MARVVVVGSINMDLVVEAEVFARPGETLLGQRFAQYPGGKGANQAVAASRLGAQVTLIGCVGDDAFGMQLKTTLNGEGIDTRWVRTADSAATATGIAAITIAIASGDNAIIVVPGANHALSIADIDAAREAFRDADVILAQLEVPLETVCHAARMAREYNKPFFLNPAPAVALSPELIDLTTLFTPNEHELTIALSGSERGSNHASDWRAMLADMPGRIVMTCGKEGAYYVSAEGRWMRQPGFAVQAVDTTGAGDTFNGALAAFWHLGADEAIRRANAAGALSVMRAGAQGGMPTLAELEHFLQTRA